MTIIPKYHAHALANNTHKYLIYGILVPNLSKKQRSMMNPPQLKKASIVL